MESITSLGGIAAAQIATAAPNLDPIAAAAPKPNDIRLWNDLFGSSVPGVGDPEAVGAPMVSLPQTVDYLSGAYRTLDAIYPSYPESIPSPMDLLSAQLQMSATQLSWQFIAKAVGTATQGFNSLVQAQV